MIKAKKLDYSGLKDTVYQQPSKMIENGAKNECVQAALTFLSKVTVTHNLKESQWRLIQQFFETAASVYNLSGNKSIAQKLLMIVALDFVDRLKMLDFDVISTGPLEGIDQENLKMAREIRNQILTGAVSTVLDEGGLQNCLRDKGGAFWKIVIFGDAFIQIGSIEDEGFPLQFRLASLSDVFVDENATDVRDPVSGNSCNELTMIYRYSWGQFCNLYPQFKDQVVIGQIPRASVWRKKLEKTWIQQIYADSDIIEVAHYWNLGGRSYSMFAGGACTPLIEYGKDDYPWILKKTKEAYIPVIHLKFIPGTEGFYNIGAGHLLYDIAVLMAEIDNMAFKHGKKNVNPVNLVKVPQGQASSIMNKVKEAQRQEAAGGIGMAVIETNNSTNGQVGIDPFVTIPISGEWERMLARLESLCGQLGFQLTPIERNGNATQMEILADEETRDKRVEQIMEFNASELKMLVKIVIDSIPKCIKKSDKTPLNLEIDIEGVDVSELTLGMVSQELKKNGSCYVNMNSRSGKIPSKTMQRAEIAQIFPTLPPGSKAQMMAIAKNSRLNGQNYSVEDLMPAQPAGGQMPQEGGGSPLQQFAAKANNPLAA